MFTFEDIMRAECNRLMVEGNPDSSPAEVAEAKANLAQKMMGSNIFAMADMVGANMQAMLDARLDAAQADAESLEAAAGEAEEMAAMYAQRAEEAKEAAEAAKAAAQAKRAKMLDEGEPEPDDSEEPIDSEEPADE